MTLSTLLTRSLFTAFLLPLGMPSVLFAQITPANDGTGTVVNTNGNQFNIEGGTLSGNGANLFHSLEKLGLNRDQIANFLANPQVRNILTRVVGGDASIINGLIQVSGGNANLYLMNPAGVIFGPNAMINVPGDFVVTTATGIGVGNNQWFNAVGSNDYQALIGNPSQFAFDLANPGAILNAGNLSVGEGKNISLIGGTVLNTGTISAPGGDITIAAIPGTSRVKISKVGNLVSLEVELSPNANQVLGINPLDLPTLLTEGKNAGVIISENTEKILAPGSAITEGAISAAGTQGGQVALVGQQVGMINGAIDVSGVNGGGTVRIGGDYQGNGTIPNASVTVVDKSSTIKADATQTGDGGKVIIWADKATGFYGNISAQGGILSGDGGFVEVSGKENLSFNGLVNVSANQGDWGTLLLDPKNITIADSSSSPSGVDSDLPDILQGNFSNQDITVNKANLQNQTANVILEATENITINPGVSLNFTSGSGSITFTADADNNNTGNFSMDTSQSITALGRSLTISGVNLTVGNIDTGDSTISKAGNVTLTATGSNLTIGNITTKADADFLGDFQFEGAGNVTLSANSGSITTGNIDAFASISGFRSGQGGTINISARNNLTTGSINASSGGGNGGSITLTSQQNSITTGELDTSGVNQGGSGNIQITANNGDITVANINSSTFQDTNYSPVSQVGQITLQTTNGNIFFNSDSINTWSSKTVGGVLNLTGNINLNQSLLTINTNGGNINFNNAVNGNVAGNNSLILNAGSGNITFNGTVGNSQSLGNLQANSSGTTSFNSTVNAASLTTNAAGSSQINGNITTTGSQTYNDAVTLQGNAILTGSNITLSNVTGTTNNFSVNAGQDIILNANSTISTGTGNVQFDAARAITLNSGSKIETTSGTINLNANQQATATTGNFDGIYLNNADISSDSGNIALKGKAGNTAGEGILLANGTPSIISSSGDITLIGQALANNTFNGGGVVEGIAINPGTISSTGIINIDGKNSLANSNGGGVYISAKIGNENNDLIATGVISISGEGSRFGVDIEGNSSFESTSLIGNSQSSRDITISSNSIFLKSARIQGKGKLFLQPLDPSASIGIGDGATGTFNLDSSKLSTIQNGFNSITIRHLHNTIKSTNML